MEVDSMRNACVLCMAASMFGFALGALLPSDAPTVSAAPARGMPKPPKPPKPPKMKLPKAPRVPKPPKAFQPRPPKLQKAKMPKSHVRPQNAATKRQPEPQKQSNAQLAQALRALHASHAVLGKGDHDYGGHRAAAERDVGKAAKSLEAALGLKGDKKKALAPRKTDPWHPEAHAKSNAQLQAQILALQKGVAVLQKGDHDYGGNRVQAIRDMKASIAQLQQALQVANSKR
jgi:outer membrane biosynthesis protein TonB